ncbi:MAG: hypothetical protein ACRECH_10875 [Nitrososphaerales archaeon]
MDQANSIEASRIAANVLESIGNTPIVQLRKIVPSDSARILAKLEWTNPTGSIRIVWQKQS